MADFDLLEAAANRISAHYKENARTVERGNEREKKRIEGMGRRGEECGEGGTRISQDKKVSFHGGMKGYFPNAKPGPKLWGGNAHSGFVSVNTATRIFYSSSCNFINFIPRC